MVRWRPTSSAARRFASSRRSTRSRRCGRPRPRTPGIATVADAPKADRGTNANQRSATRRVAINVDPHEGDPGRISADEFQSAVTRLKDAGASQARVEATEQEDRQHLWRYAFVMMIAALVGEGIVASRTG